MSRLDLVDRLMELQIVDERETEVKRWLTYDDKVAILDAVEKHGRGSLGNVTKGGIAFYSRDLGQTVGHDSDFLEKVFLSPKTHPRSILMKYTGPAKILLIWADHSFPNSAIPAIDSYSPFKDRAKHLSPDTAEAKRSVIYGSSFTATIQFRTPLRILEQHGRIEHCNHAKLPALIKEAWEGIWTPETKSFRDLGIDINDFSPGTMASEIGPIDSDGGDLLRFLILIRRIARSDTDLREKLELMKAASCLYGSGGHAFEEFMRRWGGPAVVLSRLT